MHTTYVENKIPAEEKKNWLDRVLEIWATVYAVLHFVPLLTSVCWIIFLATGQNEDVMYVLAPIMLIGLVAALLTHPFKIIWFVLKRVAAAFVGPLVAIPLIPLNLIAAAVGCGIAATLCIGTVVFAPGCLTLYYFFQD